MDLKTFKKENSLEKLATRYLNLDLMPGGIWQTCPHCKSQSSFIINQDNTYKCMKPSCSLYKRGDIINLIRLTKDISFTECLNILGCESTKQTVRSKPNSQLEEIYEYLKDNLLNSSEALEYIYYRYNLTEDDLKLPQFNIGYSNNGLDDLNIYGNRLVFPIKDKFGNLRHFHTREISESSTLRWLPTTTFENELSFADYIWNQDLYLNNEHLFLTEGISDGLALSKLKFPVVSLLSLNSNKLVDNFKQFRNLKQLVVILDNDRKGTREKGKFKSWDSVIGSLLRIYKTGIKVWCLFPPYKVGIKDVNDWISEYKLNHESFLQLTERSSTPVIKFFLDHYWDEKSKHLDLLLSLKTTKDKELVLRQINSEGNYIDYIQEVLTTNESLLKRL